MSGMTAEQKAEYEESGCVLLPGLFGQAECESQIEHMLNQHSGALQLDAEAAESLHAFGTHAFHHLGHRFQNPTTRHRQTHRNSNRYVTHAHQGVSGANE